MLSLLQRAYKVILSLVLLVFSFNLNERDGLCQITTNADKPANQSKFIGETCIWYNALENM